jgi:hypothetical protein
MTTRVLVPMPWIWDDGGRAAAGYTGMAPGDCVCRAIAIVSGLGYQVIYDWLNVLGKEERITARHKVKARSSARNGVRKPTIRRALAELGWAWTPTMGIGTGCTVHLAAGELPGGRLAVKVSGHLTAVINGVVRDNHDPGRDGTRCVYGYFTPPAG